MFLKNATYFTFLYNFYPIFFFNSKTIQRDIITDIRRSSCTVPGSFVKCSQKIIFPADFSLSFQYKIPRKSIQ
jgi:hypothetical protein